ncbi:MAG: type II secretion system F family protein [Coxiellaceae bacterium]|nr:type II secretion system F family protein [Coxiellaceae bacterium]
MAEFTWIGITPLGKKIEGTISSSDKKSAINTLLLENMIILTIKKNYHFTLSKKISKKALLAFSEQLLLLLQSGITLSDSLGFLSESTDSKNVELLLKKLQCDLNNGLRFSTALEKFPNFFSKTYCKIISAGEESGELSIVLLQLINNQTQHLEMLRKIKKALFYPLTILVIALMVCIGLLIFVIPQFSRIYSNFGAKLPTMTQNIIAISHTLTHHAILSLLISTLLPFVFKKINVMSFLTQFSFFKTIHIARNIVQWSQILSMALNAHMHLIDALTLANQTLTHQKMQAELNSVKNSVIAGEKLHKALEYCDYFPTRARHFIAIGENADALNSMVEKVAYYYTQQFADHLEHLSKLIEPVIMIIVASLVSGLIIAMYLPVFKMGSVI